MLKRILKIFFLPRCCGSLGAIGVYVLGSGLLDVSALPEDAAGCDGALWVASVDADFTELGIKPCTDVSDPVTAVGIICTDC